MTVVRSSPYRIDIINPFWPSASAGYPWAAAHDGMEASLVEIRPNRHGVAQQFRARGGFGRLARASGRSFRKTRIGVT
jgi:hypothetical protein